MDNIIAMKRIYMGDPFIYTHGGKYYMTGTTNDTEGFQGYVSQDMINWSKLGFLYHKSSNPWGAGAYWAPEVFQSNGKFYMTYSCLHSQKNQLYMGLAVSDTPEGPFRDLYAPWFDLGFGTIDGHIFRDDDQKLYLYFSRNGYDDDTKTAYGVNYVVRLSADLSGPEGEPVLISRADCPWEMVLEGNRCNEGPTVLKKDGVYYLTYSANDTGSSSYGVGYMTAKNPMGPWEKSPSNPILSSGNGILSPGHNSVFKDLEKDALHMAYHARENANSPLRYVCISPLHVENGRLWVEQTRIEPTVL